MRSTNNQNDNQQGGDIVIQLSGGGFITEENLEQLVDQLNRSGYSRNIRTA